MKKFKSFQKQDILDWSKGQRILLDKAHVALLRTMRTIPSIKNSSEKTNLFIESLDALLKMDSSGRISQIPLKVFKANIQNLKNNSKSNAREFYDYLLDLNTSFQKISSFLNDLESSFSINKIKNNLSKKN